MLTGQDLLWWQGPLSSTRMIRRPVREGGRLLCSQTTARQKYRNVRDEPRVALSLLDAANPYRALDIRDAAARIVPDPDNALTTSMAKRSLDQDVSPWRQPDDERVAAVVKARHTTQMGSRGCSSRLRCVRGGARER